MSRLSLSARIIVFTLIATSVTSLVMGGGSLLAAYHHRSAQLAEGYPVVLGWGSGQVREQLSQGQKELGQLAASVRVRDWVRQAESPGAKPDAQQRLLGKVLREALADSTVFSSFWSLNLDDLVFRELTRQGPGITVYVRRAARH